jgi:succinate dehydrogenase/fumarate reductase flavoprotein subunit
VADLVVAGAGMAGLVAAAEARSAGAEPLVLEKLERPGGSMLLSSGVVWRHRDFERFRDDCPRGDEALQRLVFDRLDGDLDWLRSLGAPVLEAETGNVLTAGVRFDPGGLADALVAAAGELRLGEPLRELPEGVPAVLATGGFPASPELVRRHVTPEARRLLLRAAPGATGDGLRLGLRAGGRESGGLDEIYGRNMPAPPARVGERDFVRLAQLYARHAEVVNAHGEVYRTRTWSEIDVVQWTARQPGARAWYRVPDAALEAEVRDRTVRDMVEAAAEAGAPVRREQGTTVVETVAGITSTLGGLAVDAGCRVAPGVYACGGDVGGIATGGYGSGLAAALVLGRIAARTALAEGGAETRG